MWCTVADDVSSCSSPRSSKDSRIQGRDLLVTCSCYILLEHNCHQTLPLLIAKFYISHPCAQDLAHFLQDEQNSFFLMCFHAKPGQPDMDIGRAYAMFYTQPISQAAADFHTRLPLYRLPTVTLATCTCAALTNETNHPTMPVKCIASESYPLYWITRSVVPKDKARNATNKRARSAQPTRYTAVEISRQRKPCTANPRRRTPRTRTAP